MNVACWSLPSADWTWASAGTVGCPRRLSTLPVLRRRYAVQPAAPWAPRFCTAKRTMVAECPARTAARLAISATLAGAEIGVGTVLAPPHCAQTVASYRLEAADLG